MGERKIEKDLRNERKRGNEEKRKVVKRKALLD